MKLALPLLFIAILAVPSFSPSPLTAPPQEPDAKKKLILEWLALNKQDEQEKQMVSFMIKELKSVYPNVPKDIWKKIREDVKQGEMVEQLAVVFDRHFSQEEMQALVNAHKAFMKLASPEFSKDQNETGRKFGFELSKKMRKQLEAQGYKKGK